MVNRETITERLRTIEENIVLLEELKSIPFDKFRDDPKTSKCVERCMEVSIQCILDICHHIIVDNNWPRPKDNKEAILAISQKGIIPSEFANRILPMAGLRNILAHEYLKVDLNKLYKHLQNLDDFHTFQKHILAYIQN